MYFCWCKFLSIYFPYPPPGGDGGDAGGGVVVIGGGTEGEDEPGGGGGGSVVITGGGIGGTEKKCSSQWTLAFYRVKLFWCLFVMFWRLTLMLPITHICVTTFKRLTTFINFETLPYRTNYAHLCNEKNSVAYQLRIFV